MFRRVLPALTAALLALPGLAAAAPRRPAPAPEIRLPGREGNVDLAGLRGRPVIVDFWASWCVPCRSSFPWLAKMQQAYSDKGLMVVAVNLDKDPKAAAAFLESVPAPFTIAYDPAGKSAEAFHVNAMPSTFLVDRKGTIVYTHVGFDSRKTAEFERKLQEACAP